MIEVGKARKANDFINRWKIQSIPAYGPIIITVILPGIGGNPAYGAFGTQFDVSHVYLACESPTTWEVDPQNRIFCSLEFVGGGGGTTQSSSTFHISAR
jgi:hypothetical protein